MYHVINIIKAVYQFQQTVVNNLHIFCSLQNNNNKEKKTKLNGVSSNRILIFCGTRKREQQFLSSYFIYSSQYTNDKILLRIFVTTEQAVIERNIDRMNFKMINFLSVDKPNSSSKILHTNV